jgi:nucleotide-binding universal stress UspA family protein
VVVVPRDRDPGESVLVAYGSGREVARALQTLVLLGWPAMSQCASSPSITTSARAETRLGPAARFLAAHNARAVLRPVASEAAPAGLILEEVRRRRPRLLVMGAHGHHPVRDLFFTSAPARCCARRPCQCLSERDVEPVSK